MKKLITYSTICLITILVFSSCKSKWGITKRHYSNGYYVAHSKDRKAALKVKDEKVVQTKVVKPLLSLKAKEVVASKENAPTIVASNEKVEHKIVPQKLTIQSLKSKISITENPVVQIKHTLLEIKKSKSGPSAGDGEGLSLFWIIILVILILWALGYISGGFGLGSFINILLVVALILLILWLLRIL